MLGKSDTIGGLQGAGSVDLSGYELTINQSASEAVFSGIISGSSVSSDLRKQLEETERKLG